MGVDDEDFYDEPLTEAFLEHIGIARRSGRYPWGSGKDPLQRAKGFKSYVDDLKAKGLTDAQIAEGLDVRVKTFDPHASFKTTDLRAGIAISTEQIFAANQAMAYRLKSKGMSTSEIARRMSSDEKQINESTVRGWLKKSQDIQEGSLRATAEALRAEVDKKSYLDVGKGNELWMGVTDTKLRTAVAMLRDEGYELHLIKIPQLGTDKNTEFKVLAKPGTPWREVYDNRDKIKTVQEQSDDGGLTYKAPVTEPVSFSSKRLQIRYAEDGGETMDGVLELRRGVPELDLGASRYAQVRVAVDGTHYLKGMAMYADNLPDGVDIRFNTNKPKGTPALGPKDHSVLKPMKTKEDDSGKRVIDTDNPFGATTHQKVYLDKNGNEHTSALNIVNEEGRWDDWSRSLSSQMLSKQPLSLAAQQLGKTRKSREDEFARINSLTNPVVKKKLLEEFADSADSAAVHLKAAAMDRQSTHVILPMNSMRPNEIYAPKFDNGDRVVLVRYPHGGPFEIPELTVNNKNLTAKRILGNAEDAVGIHHSVAKQLSGADFDGDTVLVIPNNQGKVKTKPPLAQLEGFDPKSAYPGYEGMKRMSKRNTQTEMGKISNLITDMTIKKASDDELARAVKHSMVVIDAEKHGLNYKQSELDNGIRKLKEKYQGINPKTGQPNGAATLISRASSDARVPEQKLRKAKDGGPVDPKTGKLVWVKTGDTREKVVEKVNKRTGEVTRKVQVEPKTTKGTKMEFTDDARTLSSGTPMEELYASHANSMKEMANAARKISVGIKSPGMSKAAKAVYADEVKSLDSKLKVAQRNAPLERRAQVLGNARARARIEANPQLEKDDIKKIKYQELQRARDITGASKKSIVITDREWEAIQSGAVAATKLGEILTHADMDRVKDLATPRPRTSLTTGQVARIKQLHQMGRSVSEISESLGIPRSTLVDNLKATG